MPAPAAVIRKTSPVKVGWPFCVAATAVILVALYLQYWLGSTVDYSRLKLWENLMLRGEQSQPQAAVQCFREAALIVPESKNHISEMATLNDVALCETEISNFAAARQAYERALALANRTNSPSDRQAQEEYILTLVGLANVYLELGHVELARHCLSELQTTVDRWVANGSLQISKELIDGRLIRAYVLWHRMQEDSPIGGQLVSHWRRKLAELLPTALLSSSDREKIGDYFLIDSCQTPAASRNAPHTVNGGASNSISALSTDQNRLQQADVLLILGKNREATDLLQKLAGSTANGDTRVKALSMSSVLLRERGQYNRAEENVDKALQCCSTSARPALTIAKAQIVEEAGHYEEASNLFQAALALSKQAGDGSGVMVSLDHLARLAGWQHQQEQERKFLLDLLAQQHKSRPNPGAERHTLSRLIKICGSLGLLDEAIVFARRLLELKQGGDPEETCDLLLQSGQLCMQGNRFTTAYQLLTEAREVWTRSGRSQDSSFWYAQLLAALGHCCVLSGRLPEAENYQRCYLAFAQSSFPEGEPSRCKAMESLALTFGKLGKAGQSEALLNACLREAEKGGQWRLQCHILSDLARLCIRKPDYQQAERYARRASQVAQRLDRPQSLERINSLLDLVQALTGEKRYSEAEVAAREALEICRLDRVVGQRREPPIRFELGVIFCSQKRFREAQEELERARAYCASSRDPYAIAQWNRLHNICQSELENHAKGSP